MIKRVQVLWYLNKDDLEKLRSYFKTVSKEKSKAGDLWNEYIKTANQLR